MRNLLIVQTSFLGDLILTTPLLGEVRRRFPKIRITILTTPGSAPILSGHPDVDQVLVDDKRGRDGGVLGAWRTACRLRKEHFDTVIAVHRSFRTALYLRLAGIPRRIGFRESRGWFLLTETVARDRDRHDVERTLCLLRAFGVEPEECEARLSLAVSEDGRRTATQLLDELGIDQGPLFGIAPGSVWATKRWSPEGFAAVSRELVRAHGGHVLLIGGPNDLRLGEAIVLASGGVAVNLVGRTDLPALVALVARLDLLITNDSAPLHVASALGIPRVAIFCATSPSQGFGPWGGRAVVVEKDLECRPCGRHGSNLCPRGTEDCIALVRAEDVLSGVRELLP